MERELFRQVQAALRPLRGVRLHGQRFSDADIVLVAWWAGLHDRPMDWACRRENWPPARFPRPLPDQSTMSRRLRTDSVGLLVRGILLAIARLWAPSRLAVLDGRALPISHYSKDPHARPGYGRGGVQRGYRLHVLSDAASGRVLAYVVTPMDLAEPVVARVLIKRAREQGLLAADAVVLADSGYDVNPLYRSAAEAGVRMLAPRRRPGAGLGKSIPGGHASQRLISILANEHEPALARKLTRARGSVERVFSRQVCTAGALRELPTWARTMPRVRLWTDLKLLVHALTTLRLAARSSPSVA